MSDVVQNVIHARGLMKRYGATEALRGLDWSVPAGSITALVGPNGAGKSTAVKLMLGLSRRDGGELRVFGDDPARSAVDVRRRIGFVPEDKTGFDALRVGELARYTASFYPTWRGDAFTALLADWRLSADAKISSLSKGGRSKVFLAMALAHDPELLLLDEPTDGLDPVAQEDLLRRLVDAAARGRTVVIVTHRLSEVEAIADRVAMVGSGRVLLDGELDDLRERWMTIRTRTSRSLEDVRRLPSARHVTRAGETTVIVSDSADDTVAALGDGSADISVTPMNLRELYLAVSAADGGASL